MKNVLLTACLALCMGILQAQQGFYVGNGVHVKIGAKDTLMIHGDLINANPAGYLTIHNAGHILLTGDLEDRGKGLFQSSSLSNGSTETEVSIDDTQPPVSSESTKIPRGHIYFTGDTLQRIRSAQDTTVWLAFVHVHNAVKLENSVRILGTLTLYDSLDLNGHDIYHYVYEDFRYTGNWGKWANETDTSFVFDSQPDSAGAVRMLKSGRTDMGDFQTIGLTVAAKNDEAKLLVIRRHVRDMGVTSGSIRKYYDVVSSENLQPNDSLGIAYFHREFNPADMQESDFSLFELRTDNNKPKAKFLQSELDTMHNRVVSNNDIRYKPGLRYTVASTRCSDAPPIYLGNDTLLCAGNSLTLYAEGAQHQPVHYEWKRGAEHLKAGYNDNKNDSILLLSEAGTYMVRVTDNRGCETIDSIIVRIVAKPQPLVHAAVRRQCEDNPFTFWYTDASPATITQVRWTFGDNTASSDSLCSKSYAPLCNTYTVCMDAVSTEGCTAADSLTVIVEQRRQPQIRLVSLYDTIGTLAFTDTLQNCPPENILPVTWYINGEAVGTNPRLENYHFAGYGDYTVGLRLQGTVCTAYIRDTVHVRPPGVPRFNLPKKDCCAGDAIRPVNVSEEHSGAFTYYWNYGNGKLSQGILPIAVAYAEAGTYVVSLTMESQSIQGWQRVYKDTVYVHAYPVIRFGGAIFHCNAQYTLRPEETQPHYTYEWLHNGVTAGSGASLPAVADGTYSLTVTNTLYGCRSAESVALSLNNHLQPQLGDDREICGQLTLDAHNPGAIYDWNTGDVTREITVNTSGTYHVHVRDAAGCEGWDTVSVVIYEMPETFLGDDISLCSNESVVLRTPSNVAGAHYQWSTGSTDESIMVVGPGIYSVKITHPNGFCAAEDTIRVIEKQAPVISFPDKYYVCNGQSVTVSQNNHYYADAIHWVYPDGKTATGPEIQTAQIGTHTVYVHYTNGCQATGNVTVNAGATNAIANFMVASKAGVDDILQFVNLSYPEPLDYRWEADNVLFSTEENPQLAIHSNAPWMTKDTFDVRLTVSNGACPVSRVKQIIIMEEGALKIIDHAFGEEIIISKDTVVLPEPPVPVEALEAKVYPNPVTMGQFRVEINLPEPIPVQIAVFNLVGLVMDRKTFTAMSYQQAYFYTGNYPTGLYLVHIAAGKQTRIFKLLVKNL
jgi:PKD repeat protein